MHDIMTPREIVSELDRYIIGQNDAKRAVAIALRNRWRRKQVPSPMREEITPKNILMIGPTGVGKTEIARRLASLARAPFVKVEATKYPEVGYVGRDVESMVRDLVETSMKIVRSEHLSKLEIRAEEAAEERLLDILIPHPVPPSGPVSTDQKKSHQASREKMRIKLRNGDFSDRQVEIELSPTSHTPSIQMFSNMGGNEEDVGLNLQEMLGGILPNKTKKKRMRVEESYPILRQQEADRLLDIDAIKAEAISRAENDGIIFLDEMDKITHRSGKDGDVSREGVQRDLLPLVEGTTANTRYGSVKTDHILFIASGAFHLSKPSDLIPELQGRFPIRVSLSALNGDDFRRILVEPEASLTRQYQDLLATEGMDIVFDESAIAEIAKLAVHVNEQQENIGARRLHTLLERLLDSVSFDANERSDKLLNIDAAYVQSQLSTISMDEDLSRYIL
ncbi:MAG: ATP-dependent protease ATPase subunit HslU [Mariprofundaceae bacterium]